MGVKKSTVCTSAISSVSLYTPASSAVDVSTRRFGSCCGGSCARACPNTVGLIFEAQPAQATRLVSFHCFCLRNIALSPCSAWVAMCPCHTVAHPGRFCPEFSMLKSSVASVRHTPNRSISARGRRKHDTASVVVPRWGAHWRIWDPHWGRWRLCPYPHAAVGLSPRKPGGHHEHVARRGVSQCTFRLSGLCADATDRLQIRGPLCAGDHSRRHRRRADDNLYATAGL